MFNAHNADILRSIEGQRRLTSPLMYMNFNFDNFVRQRKWNYIILDVISTYTSVMRHGG